MTQIAPIEVYVGAGVLVLLLVGVLLLLRRYGKGGDVDLSDFL